MALYEITYKCGHEGREQIYGKTSERQGRADWIGEHKLCPDCYAAEKDRLQAERAKGHDTTSAAAAAANKAAGLPALTGSPGQIAWAETIRATLLADIDKYAEGARQIHQRHAADRWT